MRKAFDESIKELHNDILRMSSATEKQIFLAIDALINHDIELAKKVIDNDDEIDKMQKDIDDKSIRLIAMQNPIATDLRDIFSATKVAADIERMADHAVDIAKIAKKLVNETYIKKLIDIPKMAELVGAMIKDGIAAYLNRDVEASYEICKKDDEIDGIYKDIFEEFLEMLSKDSNTTNQIAQFLFVCKYLERIADHVTNICENTIYLVTGVYLDLNE